MSFLQINLREREKMCIHIYTNTDILHRQKYTITQTLTHTHTKHITHTDLQNTPAIFLLQLLYFQ